MIKEYEVGNIDAAFIEHLDMTIIEFEYRGPHGENNGVVAIYGNIQSDKKEINDAIEDEFKKLKALG